jgi:hypothetical protein
MVPVGVRLALMRIDHLVLAATDLLTDVLPIDHAGVVMAHSTTLRPVEGGSPDQDQEIPTMTIGDGGGDADLTPVPQVVVDIIGLEGLPQDPDPPRHPMAVSVTRDDIVLIGGRPSHAIILPSADLRGAPLRI